MIKIGLKPTMGVSRDVQETPVDQFEKIIAITRGARDAGFHSVWVGQHYFAGKRIHWEAIPTLARLIPEAGSMTTGTCILLPPLHDPVLMAEQVAMLDIFSRGRFVCGVGLGYREREFAGFGIPRRERVGRFEEALAIMKRLWTEEHVTFDGKYFKINDLSTGTRPLQTPSPPIWVAAHADPAVKRAARLGDGLVMNPHASIATLERQLSVYREALRELGRPFPREIACRKDIFIAPARSTAWAEAREEVPKQVRSLQDFGQDRELPESESYDLRNGLDAFIRARYIIGDPEDCIEQIESYQARVGVNHFIFRLAGPQDSVRDRLAKIELMGNKVLPYFRKAQNSPPTAVPTDGA